MVLNVNGENWNFVYFWAVNLKQTYLWIMDKKVKK